MAWTDWTILLDQTGGPNHVGNLCFAPVHGNTITDEFTFTNLFYYIGHFSEFTRLGAKRISSATSSNSIIFTAFKNLDNSIIIMTMNSSDVPLEYSITMNSKTSKLNSKPHSIQTIVFN
ncbi:MULTISPECIES: glycoside hydrolase family 30 beta sandwich domain-containing protein [unclassified Polaribacter]|uniref:glycoside hydrolase family 30 beta sandwich domain-containing protein n=1 Tax=unclassified Polaribacter TaxID=196858 RepID=UPI0021D38C98|nr:MULTISPECIES: glycoside hydrolase family 30 protein [unclassified Polaribacter]